MKKVILLITAVLFLLAGGIYAQDSTGTVVKKEKMEYQDFIDKNNNGINDKLEEQRKRTTKVEQKRDFHGQKIESPTKVIKAEPEKTEISDSQKVDNKTEIKKDSALKPKSE